MEGFVTNANYSVKKLQFLLFINRTLAPRLIPRLTLELEMAWEWDYCYSIWSFVSNIRTWIAIFFIHRSFGWQHRTSQRSWNSVYSLPTKEHPSFHLHEVRRGEIEIVQLWDVVMTCFFFSWCSIEILPSNVDVNVHPTKHEASWDSSSQDTFCILPSLMCSRARTGWMVGWLQFVPLE